MSKEVVIVAGLGEVGKPLLQILERRYHCIGIDVEPVVVNETCSVLHICYPFQIRDFVGTTTKYIERFRPKLTIINSTIAVGTTREVHKRVSSPLVYSPVRGKHAKMEQDMLRYQKFVAAIDSKASDMAFRHFSDAGFKVATFPTLEAGELGKLLETTWLGVLVGWAQEVERLATSCGATYADVDAFVQEIDYLPKGVFPGYIGGHCVMPNIAILRKRFESKFLDAVVESNECKQKESLVHASD